MNHVMRKVAAFAGACSMSAMAVAAATPVVSSIVLNKPSNRLAAGMAIGAPVMGKARTDARLIKFDAVLNRLSRQVSATGAAPTTAVMKRLAPTAHLRSDVPRTAPSVLVDITVKGDATAAKAQLVSMGMSNGSVFKNLISGWLPVDRLVDAAALDNVHTMRASRMRARTGSVESQGDFIQRSTNLRASTVVPGIKGTGVTVGVMSDSFDCIGTYSAGQDTYATDVSTGDLPAGVNVIEDFGGAMDGAPNCQDGFGDEGTDEGRGMAQVVYDVAPGSKLAFYTAFNGEADFANGILALAAAGATVITDDVGYFDEPFFQDGVVSQAVDTVNAQGVAYFSSAGNDAQQSWEGPWIDSGTAAAAGTGNAGEELMAFKGSDGSTSNFLPINYFSDSAGDTYVVTAILEWDQPYVTGAPTSGGATSSLDICQTDETGAVQTVTDPTSGEVFPVCSGLNIVSGDPVSIVQFETPGGPVGGLAVGLAPNTPPPGNLKIVFADDGYGTQAQDPFATYSGTLQGHPGAAGAAGIGATYWRHTPVCSATLYPQYQLEAFSSSGGDPILFDVNGKALPAPVFRQKPDFVAPDGGATTFFGSDSGATVIGGTAAICNIPPHEFLFRGTSEASPHAAGVAALLQQAQPTATPAQIFAAMASTAIDMTAPGLDYDSGAGFIQADAALAQVEPAATLTPGSLSFAATPLGSTSATQTATLTDSGPFALTIGTITNAPDFTQTNDCPVAPATLAPGALCTFTVSFKPTHDGAISENIVIASNDPASPAKLAVSGQATSPRITLTPASLSFVSSGTSSTGFTPTQTITVTSTGDGPATLNGITITGEFSETNNCGASLAVGATCTVQVAMATTLDSLNKTGTLSVASNSTSSPATASLSGQIVSRDHSGSMPAWLMLPGLAAALVRRRKKRN